MAGGSAVVDLEADVSPKGASIDAEVLEVDLESEAPTAPAPTDGEPILQPLCMQHSLNSASLLERFASALRPPLLQIDLEAEGNSGEMQRPGDQRSECTGGSTSVAYCSQWRIHSGASGSSEPPTKQRLCTIPCEGCGEAIAFDSFEAHMKSCMTQRSLKRARLPDSKCPECGVELLAEELEDHTRAHRLERRLHDRDSRAAEKDLGDGTPETLAFRVVKLLRERGQGLPGNRVESCLKPGTHVHALWKDDQRWYRAVISNVNSDSTYAVAWSAPYQDWDPEPRQRLDAIASLDGAETREVVNFDICVKFVRRMMALAQDGRQGANFTPEIVFHWTPVQNQAPIIEESLLVPGEQTTSGKTISAVNGQALGKGIYTSTDPNFGASYGAGARGAFMCLGLPGLAWDMQSQRRPKRAHKRDQCDSLHNGTVRVYTDSDLLLPCFITEVTAVQKLHGFLLEVIQLLLAKIDPTPKGHFRVGQKVEAVWSPDSGGDGSWWAAEIARKHVDGTYKIRWLPPYHQWKEDNRKKVQELRVCPAPPSGGN